MTDANAGTFSGEDIEELNATNLDSPELKTLHNKSITCEDPHYLTNMINARIDVINALTDEKEMVNQIEELTNNLDSKRKENRKMTQEYIEMGKRRYTIEFIDEMILRSKELFVERQLKGIKQRVINSGYSYEDIEMLITFDELLKSKYNNSSIQSTEKYKESFFTKVFSKLMGGEK